MKMNRKLRKEIRSSDAANTKAANNIVKTKERTRRDARMVSKLKAGSLPYTPPVMSWLSSKLDKPSAKITPEDIKPLLK